MARRLPSSAAFRAGPFVHCPWLWLPFTVWAFGCVWNGPGAKSHSFRPADWIAWQAKRRESVAGTNGWTTLVGLYWLQEGRSFAGSDPTNDFALSHERAAASVGSFVRAGREIRFEAAPGVTATVAGKPVRSVALQSDARTEPTRLQLGPLTVRIIERGERIGLRVCDPMSPARLHFRGLKYFDYDSSWRMAGRFERSHEVKKLRVQDVTGGTQELISPGAVVFARAGTEHRLEVVEETDAEEYFVIFHDQTAGRSTYAAGRFLYVAKPDASGRVLIDFNRAYTPPCAFTPFATCPLPPRQNWLPFPVRAGEQKPDQH